MTTTTVAPGIPSVREVRTRLRRARRAHSDRTLGELLTDVYLIAFLVVLYGGSGAVTLRRHLAKPVGGPIGLESTRSWLVVALLVTVGILGWRGLRTLGPLITTPAAQSWCLSTPIDRGGWLRLPLYAVLAGSAAVGVIVGVLAEWLGLRTSVFWAAFVGAAVGVMLAGLSAVVQSRQRGRTARVKASDIALLVSIGLVLAAVVTRVTHITTGPPGVPAPVFAAVAVLGAAASVRLALRALGRVDRAALAGGAALAGAAVTAVVMLDPSLFSGLIEARRWRTASRTRSLHFLRGGREWVLLQADVRRQWRRKSGLIAWAALILAPYAVGVFSPSAIGSTRIIAGYLAAERLAAGLRLVSRSSSLRRQLGGSNTDLKLIHLAVPAFGLLVWWLASLGAGAVPSSQTVGIILVLGTLAAVYRTATRPQMSYDTGTANTPMGPIPTTILRRLIRGPDLVAILVLVGLLF
jgi:Family of unknown function (DUF6297)